MIGPHPLPHRKRPCSECPWRLDTDPGQFSAERYEALQATSGTPGNEAPLDAPMFACHKSADGHETACAGWLAAVGIEHLGIRVATVQGRLPASALRPGDDWPELHQSYPEMSEAKARSES